MELVVGVAPASDQVGVSQLCGAEEEEEAIEAGDLRLGEWMM
jgi:hypothetical protein